MSNEHILWSIFWLLFLVVSAIDYSITSRRKAGIGVKEALRWTALWVCVALSYTIVIYWLHPFGRAVASQFIAGYLTEYSLSIDNLFVFILIFSLMGVEEVAQPKLIKLGIYLSIFLRIVFILLGVALLNTFHWLIYGFGALLIWTGWKMLVSDQDEQVHPESNLLYKLAARFLPLHKEPQETKRLFTHFNGRLHITSLFLVFVVIGSTDVLFAIDSIPAIMGISQDPLVVVTSNVFAVMGLNSLFFAIRGIMGLFKFLKHGVSLILFFIGLKMVAGIYHPIEDWFRDRSWVSLVVILSVLTLSILLSLWHDRKHPGSTAE